MMQLRNDDSEKVPYNFTDYPIHVQKCLLSSYPHYSAPSHWHDDIELILILSGAMSYNVNGEILTLTASEGIFVNARQMHFGFSNAKEECEFLCILLHPMLLGITSAYERDFVLPVLGHGSLPFVHLKREIPWQDQICKQLQSIYAVRKDPAAQLKILSAFMTVWTLLYEHTPPAGKKTDHKNSDLVSIKNMISFIQNNYPRKVSLSDIAASGLVGQSKCCKLFSKYLRQTPNLYLTQYRLNKSMELLTGTNKSITEIAIDTGFGNGSYYAEVFRKWTGTSPTKYRNETTNLPLF
ncbi:MAG: helix-turn-helix domain-containing protein [Lachnospiraceae bacterium]